MPRDLKKRRSNLPADGRIPRPANCFMIFRADWHRNSIANSTPGSHGGKKQKDVSQEAAVAWKDLSPTLKQLYKVQAEIVKEEHSKKYPGWVYQPNAGKRKNMIADAPQGGSLAKRVARSHMTVPPQKPSPDAKGKRKATVTPLTKTPVPMEPVWDGSWFSGSSSMRDPFYSAPLQPIASSTTTSPPIVPPHPHFFPTPAQMHGFGMVSNFPAIPPMYHPAPGLGNDRPHNPERYDHDASTTADNTFDLSCFRQLPQMTTLEESSVSSGPRIVPSNSTGDSSLTVGSTDEVPTPESEVESPTQAVVERSELTYDNLLENYYNNDCWKVNQEFNPNLNPFSMTEL